MPQPGYHIHSYMQQRLKGPVYPKRIEENEHVDRFGCVCRGFEISTYTSSTTPVQWKWITIIFGESWHLKSSLFRNNVPVLDYFHWWLFSNPFQHIVNASLVDRYLQTSASTICLLICEPMKICASFCFCWSDPLIRPHTENTELIYFSVYYLSCQREEW